MQVDMYIRWTTYPSEVKISILGTNVKIALGLRQGD